MAVRAGASYSVVISGIWVLVAGDDLWSHPVGCAYECVSPSNRPVQLSAYAKINYGTKSKKEWSTINKEEEEESLRGAATINTSARLCQLQASLGGGTGKDCPAPRSSNLKVEAQEPGAVQKC